MLHLAAIDAGFTNLQLPTVIDKARDTLHGGGNGIANPIALLMHEVPASMTSGVMTEEQFVQAAMNKFDQLRNEFKSLNVPLEQSDRRFYEDSEVRRWFCS